MFPGWGFPLGHIDLGNVRNRVKLKPLMIVELRLLLTQLYIYRAVIHVILIV